MISGLFAGAPLDITPASILAMWAAGLATGSGLVSAWRIVGSGYVWLSGGVTLLFGIPAALSGSGMWAILGIGAVILAIALARTVLAPYLFVIGGLAFGIDAVFDGGVAATITGAVLLGGITAEMMLGHWFLIDPRLPRWTLRRLDLIAGVGVLADLGVLALLGAFPWESGDLVVGVGYLVLIATTLVLIVAVWASLGEEGYPAVMAATGLSYLAVLTAIGAAVIGRLLVAGSVLG